LAVAARLAQSVALKAATATTACLVRLLQQVAVAAALTVPQALAVPVAAVAAKRLSSQVGQLAQQVKETPEATVLLRLPTVAAAAVVQAPQELTTPVAAQRQAATV